MRAGDAVKHGPTGETWLVAAVEGDRLYPAGWPLTMADTADCTLVKACSDEKHADYVERFARMSGGYDPRQAISQRILNATGEGGGA